MSLHRIAYPALIVGSLLFDSIDAFSLLHPAPPLLGGRRQGQQRMLAARNGRIARGSSGLVCSSSSSQPQERKKVLVVGGTGRVGGSTARWLLEFGDEEGVECVVVLAGRSERNYETSVGRIARKVRGWVACKESVPDR